jgi:hypothetical protein
MRSDQKVITPDGPGVAFIVGEAEAVVKLKDCFGVYPIAEIKEEENGYEQQSLFG